MNEIGIVRLETLKIRNFKNIEYGEIFFSEKKKVLRGEIDEDDFKNILGIYGQNGSGKTACLNALRLVQTMLSGNPLNPIFSGFIMIDKPSCNIISEFLINIASKYYYVTYDIEIERIQDKIRIINERLSFKDYKKDEENVLSFKYSLSNGVNTQFLEKINKNLSTTYGFIAAYESNNITNPFGLYSTIFNPKLYELVHKNKSSYGIYFKIIKALRVFGLSRLSIYSINYFNENDNVGIRFRYKEENVDKTDEDIININCGDIFVPFIPYQLSNDQFKTFKKTIENINKVLPSIIPSFIVEIVIPEDKALLNKYNGNISFILVGKRNGKRIPLQYESNGIKKIISILSGLIEAYTNEGCLMAVDEIDSGVFEYLLGEIVYAFDNFANGQLIFTSHNMRILEKLNYKNIFFATTDSKNVFIQLKNVKEHNNLRDLYYRYLANGDQNGNQYYDTIKTEDLIANMRVHDEDLL